MTRFWDHNGFQSGLPKQWKVVYFFKEVVDRWQGQEAEYFHVKRKSKACTVCGHKCTIYGCKQAAWNVHDM